VLRVHALERGYRPLELAKLLLAPASRDAAQAVGARALHTKALGEEVDRSLVERLSPAVLLAIQGLGEIGRQVSDRQSLNSRSLSGAVNSCIQWMQ
jgi:hypothetical protein